jgi:hypothetical protein
MAFASFISRRLHLVAHALISSCLFGCAAEGRLTLNGAWADAGANSLERRKEGGDRSTPLSRKRFKATTCAGYDLTPEKQPLTIDALKNHLKERSIEFTVTPERDDLHLFDLEFEGQKAQLRVATLESPREAGRHLHQALLEHGQGYWGVHRGNLAVLAPAGSLDETSGFALKTGLLCWGVFTQAGRDDTFAIPGGYFEL